MGERPKGKFSAYEVQTMPVTWGTIFTPTIAKAILLITLYNGTKNFKMEQNGGNTLSIVHTVAVLQQHLLRRNNTRDNTWI